VNHKPRALRRGEGNGEGRERKCVTDTAIKRRKMWRRKVESLKEGFKVKQGRMKMIN
jgi:hypothetical protein